MSPKERFLSQQSLARQFLDMVESESFRRASELAMIQLGKEAKSIDELRGAEKFLEILRGLPEPVKPAPAKPNYGISHDLK